MNLCEFSIFSCCQKQQEPPSELQIRKASDARITAFALACISLFLFALAFCMFGLGTLSPTFMNGLGILPYLGGCFLAYIALGTVAGSLFFAAQGNLCADSTIH